VEITQPFYLGAYPVTQAEYKKVTGKNPSHFSSRGGGRSKVKGLVTRRFPVERVAWEEAVEFCRLLSATERGLGRLYRLPTEAEWEYTCRGGRPVKGLTPFCLAEPTSSLSAAQANFDGSYPDGRAAKGPNLERPTTVGSYQPNPLGLFDMHGNVWEWCSDWYDPTYYQRSPRQDPQGPDSSPENYHVLRGGSWYGPCRVCRSATRNRRVDGGRIDGDGFRVVLVAGAGTA
jgi:formylglycine-generating enzyme required for sulfatase activity